MTNLRLRRKTGLAAFCTAIVALAGAAFAHLSPFPVQARQAEASGSCPITTKVKHRAAPVRLAALETPTRPPDVAKLERAARRDWAKAHPALVHSARAGSYEEVAHLVARDDWRALDGGQKQMIRRIVMGARGGMPPLSPCFAPGTDPKIIRAFEGLNNALGAFRIAPFGYWTNPASGSHSRGQVMTLTWSVVPDGTELPTQVGEPATPSDLRVRLNAIYGGESVWLPILRGVFARYAQLAGIRYVEVSDDGAPLSLSNAGGATRGDVRISGHPIDGTGKVLAYNFFPDYGDMVIDTSDGFYDDTRLDSLGLRNVLSHEHGHGLGFAHVCPRDQSKLMEPTITYNFDGPQSDDIQNAQRGYGDALEENDALIMPSSLGALPNGTTTRNTLSLDGTNDLDFFRLSVSSPKRLTVTVRPRGGNYLDGDQNEDGTCTPGTPFNANAQRNLNIAVFNAGGSLIGQADATGAGGDETLSDVRLTSANGPFTVRIGADSADQVQLYNLDIGLEDAPAVADFALIAPVTVSDTTANGNSNGRPDPGESRLRLTLTLRNDGDAIATSVTAILVSLSPGVSVVSSGVSYPNIAPGATANNTFRPIIALDESVGCGLPISLRLDVSSGQGTESIPFTLSTGAPSSQVVSYAGVPQAIPDGVGANMPGEILELPLSVSGSGLISDLNFSLDGDACSTDAGATGVGLDHSWVGDLTIQLVSPSGTVVTLANRPGGLNNGGNNFCNSLLDDEAAATIQNITNGINPTVPAPPYTGSFRPANALSAFDGEDANGIWKLRVRDFYNGDVGSVRAFSLRIDTITCQAAIPLSLSFSGQPPAVTAVATPFPVTVRIVNQAGTTVTDTTNPITLTLGDNTESATLSRSGTPAGQPIVSTPVNGVATFSNLSVDREGNYTLIASSPGLGSATSNVFFIEGPTSVRLISFEARGLSDGVWLRWRTGLETDNIGFHVFRQVRDNRGRWQKSTRLTPALIAGAALQNNRNADPRGGFAYDWTDPQATPSTLARFRPNGVRYWLQDVDVKGRTTTHGPTLPVPGAGGLAAHARSPLVGEIKP